MLEGCSKNYLPNPASLPGCPALGAHCLCVSFLNRVLACFAFWKSRLLALYLWSFRPQTHFFLDDRGFKTSICTDMGKGTPSRWLLLGLISCNSGGASGSLSSAFGSRCCSCHLPLKLE